MRHLEPQQAGLLHDLDELADSLRQSGVVTCLVSTISRRHRQLAHSLDVLAGASVYLHDVVNAHEERHVDHQAGLEPRWLGAASGGIAAHAWVGLDYADSSLQVQPFAAPRTGGLWDETRVQLRDQVKAQGGRVEEREGPLGKELLAEVPATAAEGSGLRLARFIGIDGPRWFLRGVIGGAGASDPDAAAKVEDLFRSIVVVRGGSPMPPRDLIPLKMPATPGSA